MLRKKFSSLTGWPEVLKELSVDICLYIYKVKVKSLSHVRLSATPWTVAYQAPPSVGFSRQEYWSGLPFPSPLYIYNYLYLYIYMYTNPQYFSDKLNVSLSRREIIYSYDTKTFLL